MSSMMPNSAPSTSNFKRSILRCPNLLNMVGSRYTSPTEVILLRATSRTVNETACDSGRWNLAVPSCPAIPKGWKWNRGDVPCRATHSIERGVGSKAWTSHPSRRINPSSKPMSYPTPNE